MRSELCPNCGHELKHLRSDRSHVRAREIAVTWSSCSACGHFALETWSFVESPEPDLEEATSDPVSAGETHLPDETGVPFAA